MTDGVLDLSTSTPECKEEPAENTDDEVVTSDDDRPIKGDETPRKFGEGIVRPIAGPLPSNHIPMSPEAAHTEIIQPTVVRPFKMYPFDTAPPIYSTQVYGTPAMDSAMFSPLTSYFNTKKRRADRRDEIDIDKKMKPIPEDLKDTSYWERRRKNNEAAKRSRDVRRQKEEQIAMQAAYLEQENLKLRAQVALLKNETAKLHFMLYNR